MTQQVRNVTNIIINTPGAGGPPRTTPVTTTGGVDSLAAGEIGVFKADGTRVNDANVASVTSYFLARGNDKGQGYWKSDLIVVANMTPTTSAKLPVAETEQHDTIGFDGTSGSLEAINNNLYLVRMYIQELLTSSSDGSVIKHFQYKSDATATQVEVSNGLVKSAINNFSKEATKYVAFKQLINNAGVAVGGAATSLIWTNGSKTVSADAVNQAVTGIAAGDYIRVSNTLTDACYKVTKFTVHTATTKATIELDYAFQEATATVARATNRVIAAATAATADTGVDMLGQPLAFSIGKFFYKKARWVVGLEDFGTSSSANVAKASKGIGEGKEVAEMEWFMAGFEGETYRMGEPVIYNFQGTADTSLLYAIYSISFQDVSLVGFENNISPKLLQIAIPCTAAGASAPKNAITGDANSLTKVLNAIPGITGVTLT